PHHRGYPRHRFHCSRHPSDDSERCLPGFLGIRYCSFCKPANHPVLPVLATIQHHWCGRLHLWWSDLLSAAYLLVPSSLRSSIGNVPERCLSYLPVDPSRPRFHSTRLPL